MKLSQFVKGAAVATVLSATALAASATTTALGTVAVNVPTSFGGFAPVGGFMDYFTFTLPVNGGSGYSVANFAPSGIGGTFNTILSSLALISNPDGILFNADDALVTSSVVPGGASIGMTWGASTGGDMYLVVSGVTTGSMGGLYTGAVSVTAVPEPESYAMLLAGLGVMGAIAVRRNKAKK